MKIGKRLVSLLLAMTLLLCTLPMDAFAKEDGASPATQTDQQTSYSSTNALGEVLAQAMNESDAAVQENNGYFIATVAIEETTATVELSAPDDANLVVAIYEEETMQMVTSGTVQVDSTTQIVTVELADCTMPDYYIVKAFLMNSEYAPVCNNYENLEHTKAFEAFFEKSTDDFDADKVINLDYSEQTNFAVVADDAQTAEQTADANILVTNDYENGVYVFENANADITTLTVGEVLYYQYGAGEDEYILTKIGTIEADNGTVTITAADEYEMSDFFSYIKIDSSQCVSQPPLAKAARGYDDTAGDMADFSPEFGVKVEKEVEDDNYHVSFSGELKVQFYLKFYYDFNLGEDYYELEQSTELSFTAGTSISVEAEKEFEPLVFFHGGIPIFAGLEAEMEFSLKITFSAKVEVNGDIEISMKNGSRKIAGRADEDLSHKPSIKFAVEAKGTVAVHFVPQMSVGIKILKVVKISVGAEVDFAIWGTVHAFEADTSNSIVYPDKKHACSTCLDGVMQLIPSVKMTINFGLNEKKQKTVLEITILSIETDLFDYYVSIRADAIPATPEFGLGTCPYIDYKVTFKAIDENGDPLEGVVINDGNRTLTTDKNGEAIGYYGNGTHSCTATLDDYAMDGTTPLTFAVYDGAKTVSINMKKDDGTSGGSTGQGQFDNSDLLDGAVMFNDHWYKVIENSSITDWNEAQQYCTSLNGYLATITSKDENDFVYNYKYECRDLQNGRMRRPPR